MALRTLKTNADWCNVAKNKSSDRVVRINVDLHARLKALTAGMEKKHTLNDTLELLLTTAEPVIFGEMKYAVRLFDDVADARGEAIVQAIKRKEIPEPPFTVIVLGRDTL